MFETDIDRIVEQHDSDYINGIKNMFVSGWLEEPEYEYEDEDEEDPETYDIPYIDENGQRWWRCLTADEKAEYDALETDEERLKYLKQF